MLVGCENLQASTTGTLKNLPDIRTLMTDRTPLRPTHRRVCVRELDGPAFFCHGMGLLADRCRFDVVMVVCGDAALDGYLGRAVSQSRQTVRVAVRDSASRRSRALGVERVWDDDWVCGLSFVSTDPGLKQALTEFQRAVDDLRSRGMDSGLNSVKAQIRLRVANFNEEGLGIPDVPASRLSGRALGYARIDATKGEPASAYRSGDEATGTGEWLPDGRTWHQFIDAVLPDTEYTTRSSPIVSSAALGAIAGILIAPITLTSWDVGVMLGLKGFAAAILGGLGSGAGAVVGGLLLGIAGEPRRGLHQLGVQGRDRVRHHPRGAVLHAERPVRQPRARSASSRWTGGRRAPGGSRCWPR